MIVVLDYDIVKVTLDIDKDKVDIVQKIQMI